MKTISSIVILIALGFLICWGWNLIFKRDKYQMSSLPPYGLYAILYDKEFPSLESCVDHIRTLPNYHSHQFECGKNCRWHGEEYQSLIVCDETKK